MSKFLFIIIIFNSSWSFAQNLVYNGDFESLSDSASCTNIPARIDEFSIYMGRMRFPGGLIPPPSIKFGKYWYNNNDKLAYSGKYCGGNVFYKPGSSKGLVSMSLTETLKKDELYIIQFHIRHLGGDYFLNNIDIAFSNFNHMIHHYSPSLSLKNIIRLKSYLVDSTITDKWHRITVEYKAKGTEKSLLVGCFGFPPKFIKTPVLNQADSLKGDFSVYLIDEALVMKKSDYLIYLYEMELQKKSILFDIDSYSILPQANNVIDSIYKILNLNKDLSITLIGYTDPSGENSNNKVLALKRAESIRNYFLLKGLNKNQIILNNNPITTDSIILPRNKYYLYRRVEYSIK